MSIDTFAERLSYLIARTRLFEDKPIRAVLIANPKAGGFTRKRLQKRHMAELESLAARASDIRPRTAKTEFESYATERPLHASEMARAFAERAAKESRETEFLVILAGGDGTSLEVMTEIVTLPPELRDRFTVMRLPMGTGNDGADDRDLAVALGRLIEPARIERQKAVRAVSAVGRGAWYAFNIASVGLDAYVSEMTNKLKGIFPGDSYKLWIDLSTLFYERRYEVTQTHAEFYGGAAGLISAVDREVLIIAMGISGNRTYGSNKKILPDANNVCVVNQMSLLRKLAIKDPVSKGLHRLFPEVTLLTAERMVIKNDSRLPMQLDGEVVILEPEDFPLVMELTEPAIRIIKYA